MSKKKWSVDGDAFHLHLWPLYNPWLRQVVRMTAEEHNRLFIAWDAYGDTIRKWVKTGEGAVPGSYAFRGVR